MNESKKHKLAGCASVALAIVLMASGFLLSIMGILVEVTRAKFTNISRFSYLPTAGVIALALFILIVGMIGIVGFYKEHLQVMKLFGFTVAIIILAEFALGIFCYIYSQRVTENIIFLDVASYNPDSTVGQQIDQLQMKFKCCGYEDSTDWSSHVNYACGNGTEATLCIAPKSCCSLQIDEECTYYPMDKAKELYRGNTYITGCSYAFQRWVKNKVDVIGLVSLAVILPQVVGALTLLWFTQYSRMNQFIYNSGVNQMD